MLRRRGISTVFVLGLLASGCIQDDLTVELRTEVHTDGSCDRQVSYRLQRRTDASDPGFLQAPAQDPLRTLFRFPAGPAWTVKDEVESEDVHTVTLAGRLPSPNDIGWDYWRVAIPAAPPARNRFSFAMEPRGSGSTYEYLETFLDPVSPAAVARRLAAALPKLEDAFATEFQRQFPGRRFHRGDLKRVYREALAVPLARRLTAITERPDYGPRERSELAAVFAEDEPFGALRTALAGLAPELERETTDKATEAAFEPLMARLEQEMTAAGLSLALAAGYPRDDLKVHFRATLVLPAAITRANTCFQGDTATWEFDQDDLYGRGFEMWAQASTP